MSNNTRQDWIEWVNETLRPRPDASLPLVLDLFAGCGGLALGFEAQGFRTVGYEMNAVPAATYNLNLFGRCSTHRLAVGDELEKAEIIIGGPPCQPFSQIGYQRGRHDDRDGFPVFLDIVERQKPAIAIIENVRGLLYRNKDYMLRAIDRLRSYGYETDYRLVSAVEFGVPQRRMRIVIVASRVGWSWPRPMIDGQVSAGEALGELVREFNASSRVLTQQMDEYVAAYEKKSACIRPRDLDLGRPARTLTCRNLAGATSDMMRLVLPDGRRRMLHLREAARLQSFPDWFNFEGSEAEQFEQIGNAVAPLLGYALAGAARKAILGMEERFEPGEATRPQMGLFSMETSSERLVEQAQNVLRQVGMPLRDLTERRRSRLAKALLAVARISPGKTLADAAGYSDVGVITTREIIRFWNAHLGEDIADSSYDDVRRKELLLLVEFGLVLRAAADPHADVNDGTRGYAISPQAIALLRSYDTDGWEEALVAFRSGSKDLLDRLSRAREMKMVNVALPAGLEVKLSPGPHNRLQKAIIEELLPRFAPGAQLLYVGDTAKKLLYSENAALIELGLPTPDRGILPDIVAFDPSKGWLFYIEAVSSTGPISAIRREELRVHAMANGSDPEIVFITAFPDRHTFRRFSAEIGWETEVWIAAEPDHMIHFDGEKYLSPYTG